MTDRKNMVGFMATIKLSNEINYYREQRRTERVQHRTQSTSNFFMNAIVTS